MIQQAIQEWWRDVTEYEYSLHIGLIVGVLVAVFGGRELYKMYVGSRESAAQVVMAEAFEEYDKALYTLLEGKDSKELIDQRFDDTKLAFDGVLQNHGSSSLAPYAQAFEADILLQKGDRAGAIKLLEKSIESMSAKDPVYYLIKTKRALVQLDNGVIDASLDELHALAFNKDNPTADTAAFYLGYYYWTMHQPGKAREAWKQLEPADTTVSENGVSPWLAIAQGKLQQIS